jgi:hypothetical protein
MPLLVRYTGRRFAGLLASLVTLAPAYYIGPLEKFTALTTAVSLIYSVYVTGQSYSDGKRAENGLE